MARGVCGNVRWYIGMYHYQLPSITPLPLKMAGIETLDFLSVPVGNGNLKGGLILCRHFWKKKCPHFDRLFVVCGEKGVGGGRGRLQVKWNV